MDTDTLKGNDEPAHDAQQPQLDHAAIDRDIVFGAKMYAELLSKAGDDWNRWVGVIRGMRGLHALAVEKAGTSSMTTQAWRDAMTSLLTLRKYAIYDRMEKQDRSDCYRVMDRLEDIDIWYSRLPTADKLKWKHPHTIARHCPKEYLSGMRKHNQPKKIARTPRGNPEAEALRKLLVKVVQEFVRPINAEKADKLLEQVYGPPASLYEAAERNSDPRDPNDSLDNLGLDAPELAEGRE